LQLAKLRRKPGWDFGEVVGRAFRRGNKCKAQNAEYKMQMAEARSEPLVSD
jgi:hypothetical protein